MILRPRNRASVPVRKRSTSPRRLLPVSCLLLGLLTTTTAAAQESGPAGGPQLEALGELIVGTWEAPDSRQVHEWGVGRRLIRSRGYFMQDGDWVLVSEGIWFRDDEAGVIRGIHFAVAMPVERFDYRTTVEGDEVVHQLETHGPTTGRFVETWTFDDAGYIWRLERPTDDGLERVMGGAYRRVR